MTEHPAIRILSVDDHPIFREGIASIIEIQPDMTLVSQASNAAEAIRHYRDFRPDVTLMDLRLPDLNGIDALIAIRAESPDARIIILTTFAGDADIQRSLDAGARGYLLKSTPPRELVDVIRSVHAGNTHVPSTFTTPEQPKRDEPPPNIPQPGAMRRVLDFVFKKKS